MRFQPRLYLETDIKEGTALPLNIEQQHYLFKVMRKQTGDEIVIFNGRNGEWKAKIEKKYIYPTELIKVQPITNNNLNLCFAPIKLTFVRSIMRQATELGASTLQPISTLYTNAVLPNINKCKSWIVEAAEQSERLTLPQFLPIISFQEMVNQYQDKNLIICDIEGKSINNFSRSEVVTIIVGPEGGFSEDERVMIQAKLNLNVNILRTDTAVVAALTYAQLLF